VIIIRLKEAIRTYEERTGTPMTYAELAKRTGLSRATVEALGSRSSYNTTLSSVDKLCRALGCELSDLLRYEPTDE